MGADLQLLVGKILSDQDFAKSLAENPKDTLARAGIEPTIDLLEALEGVDAESLQKLAANFGDQQAAL
jgi:hypothetical protein